jgi:hypothetical protein
MLIHNVTFQQIARDAGHGYANQVGIVAQGKFGGDAESLRRMPGPVDMHYDGLVAHHNLLIGILERFACLA